MLQSWVVLLFLSFIGSCLARSSPSLGKYRNEMRIDEPRTDSILYLRDNLIDIPDPKVKISLTEAAFDALNEQQYLVLRIFSTKWYRFFPLVSCRIRATDLVSPWRAEPSSSENDGSAHSKEIELDLNGICSRSGRDLNSIVLDEDESVMIKLYQSMYFHLFSFLKSAPFFMRKIGVQNGLDPALRFIVGNEYLGLLPISNISRHVIRLELNAALYREASYLANGILVRLVGYEDKAKICSGLQEFNQKSSGFILVPPDQGRNCEKFIMNVYTRTGLSAHSLKLIYRGSPSWPEYMTKLRSMAHNEQLMILREADRCNDELINFYLKSKIETRSMVDELALRAVGGDCLPIITDIFSRFLPQQHARSIDLLLLSAVLGNSRAFTFLSKNFEGAATLSEFSLSPEQLGFSKAMSFSTRRILVLDERVEEMLCGKEDNDRGLSYECVKLRIAQFPICHRPSLDNLLLKCIQNEKIECVSLLLDSKRVSKNIKLNVTNPVEAAILDNRNATLPIRMILDSHDCALIPTGKDELGIFSNYDLGSISPRGVFHRELLKELLKNSSCNNQKIGFFNDEEKSKIFTHLKLGKMKKSEAMQIGQSSGLTSKCLKALENLFEQHRKHI